MKRRRTVLISISAVAVAASALVVIVATRLPPSRQLSPHAASPAGTLAPPVPPSIQLSGIDPEVVASIERARAAVTAEPQSAQAWGQLGMVFHAHAMLSDARTCYGRAEELDPREPRWAYQNGVIVADEDPPASLAKLRHAVELCGDTDTSDAVDGARLRLVELLLDLGQFDEGKTLLETLSKRRPRDPRMLLNRARLAMSRGDAANARDLLVQTLTLRPDLRSARVLLTTAYLRLGDSAAAMREQAEVARRPTSGPTRWPDTWGDEVAALQSGVAASIQRAARLLSSGHPSEAAAIAARDTLTYPDAWQLWLILGRARRMMRQYDEAEQALRTAARLAPNSPEVPMELGTTCLAAGKHSEALRAFRDAAELQPDLGFAHVGAGRALEASGDSSAAAAAYRRAIALQPELADAYLALAELLAKAGQRDEAIVNLRRAVSLNPNGKRAASILTQLETNTEPP